MGQPLTKPEIKCAHCGRPIEDDDDGRIWYHPDTMSSRCDGPDDEEGLAWGDLVRQAEPAQREYQVMAIGVFTANNEDEARQQFEEWLSTGDRDLQVTPLLDLGNE